MTLDQEVLFEVRVLAVNPAVDRPYIERWARELGILDLWREIAGALPY